MSTEAIRSAWVGRVIDGRFPLLQWLGGSDWAGVFLTELREQPARKAAIKLILVDARDEEAILAGWAAAAPLSHPHLMRLFYSGRCQVDSVRLFYTVTEYAEENLSQILPERPLTPAETREMLVPVLDALSYLHDKGLLHSRLKPSNIMVVDDQLKLSCDSLRVAGGLGRHFPAKTVYDSPQGVAETVTPAADIWSLGIALVEALTQHPPAWNRTTHREPVVPESVLEPFASIARECLRSEPEHRCTLADIKTRLEPAEAAPVPAPVAALEPAEPAPEPPAALPEPPTGAKKPGAARLRWIAIAAAVLVLLGAAAILQLRSRQTAPLPPAVQQQQEPVGALSPQSPVEEAQPSKDGTIEGEVAAQVLPDVPQGARDTIRIPIQVVVRVKADASGAVSNAELDEEPVSRYFGNLALQAARSWRFKPAQVDGHAVSSEWLLRFEFAQDDTHASSEKVAP